MDVLQCGVPLLFVSSFHFPVFPKSFSHNINKGKTYNNKGKTYNNKGKTYRHENQGRYCDSKGGLLAKEKRKMLEEREVAEEEKRKHYFS
jgi:hypothetical protein